MKTEDIRKHAEAVAPHLVTLPQFAAEKGYSPMTVAIWAEKYEDFPQPVLAAGPLSRYFVRSEVEEWMIEKMKTSARFGRKIHTYPDTSVE